MKILAVDTATESCSVALVEDEALRAETTVVSRQTHSRHLMEIIQRALDMAGWSLGDLDGFVSARGPGSFTGLRIGISTVKGLCTALGKPLAGISNLEGLARQAPVRDGAVCAWIDARRNEVFCCRYWCEYGILRKTTPEDALPPAAALSAMEDACLFIGNGSTLYRQAIQEALGDKARFAPPGTNVLRASTLAFMGLERFAKNDVDDPVRFAPHYIRKSDARLPGTPTSAPSSL
jgi:tRNA threonylcarbamoyladenosine biosynthesis protein TsaB